MTKKSKGSKNISKPDFKEVMGTLNDEALTEVLRKRNLYQPEAARSAIDEAIRRGLINSEEDLLSEKYRIQPLKTRLFPEIENEHLRVKIRKSISRSLLISGILPLIFGAIRIQSGNLNEAALILIFGLIWLAFSFRLMKSFSRNIICFLLILAGISLFYIIRLLAGQPGINLIDKIAVSFFYLLLFYGLLFLLRLKT
jgi:hypothetical protein